MRKVVLCLAILSLLLTYSCKTKKQTVTRGGGDLEANRRIEEVLKHQISPRSIAARVDVSIQSGQMQLGSKGDLRIIPGEGIYLSLQPFLGIEMFRLVVTPEELIIIDRNGKRYIAENISSLIKQGMTDNPYYYIESLFLNRMFIVGKKEITVSDFKKFETSQTNNNELSLKSHVEEFADYSFTISNQNLLANTNGTLTSPEVSMDWAYSNFIEENGYTLPTQIVITVRFDSKVISLTIKAPKIEFDEKVVIDKTYPAKYEKIAPEQLIKSLIRK